MEVSLFPKIFFDKNKIMNDRWRCHFFLVYFLKWNNKILNDSWKCLFLKKTFFEVPSQGGVLGFLNSKFLT